MKFLFQNIGYSKTQENKAAIEHQRVSPIELYLELRPLTYRCALFVLKTILNSMTYYSCPYCTPGYDVMKCYLLYSRLCYEYRSIYLSIILSLHPPINQSVYFHIYPSICRCLSIYLSPCLPNPISCAVALCQDVYLKPVYNNFQKIGFLSQNMNDFHG